MMPGPGELDEDRYVADPDEDGLPDDEAQEPAAETFDQDANEWELFCHECEIDQLSDAERLLAGAIESPELKWYLGRTNWLETNVSYAMASIVGDGPDRIKQEMAAGSPHAEELRRLADLHVELDESDALTISNRINDAALAARLRQDAIYRDRRRAAEEREKQMDAARAAEADRRADDLDAPIDDEDVRAEEERRRRIEAARAAAANTPAPKPSAYHAAEPIPRQHRREREPDRRHQRPPEAPLVTGPLAAKRRNLRMADLKTLWRHIGKRFTSVDAFVDDLRGRCGGRDPGDPEQVSAQELGSVTQLTLDVKIKIEETATEVGRRRGYLTRSGRLYICRLRTVAPYDKTPEEVRKRYQRRARAAHAARRRVEKTKEKKMDIAVSYATYAEAVAADRARVKGQADAMLAAIGEGECTVADLMLKLRRDLLWSSAKPRTYRHRLDDLRDQGRIAERFEPGPRGSKRRLVRRIPDR
jgi:hypothetical protein